MRSKNIPKLLRAVATGRGWTLTKRERIMLDRMDLTRELTLPSEDRLYLFLTDKGWAAYERQCPPTRTVEIGPWLYCAIIMAALIVASAL